MIIIKNYTRGLSKGTISKLYSDSKIFTVTTEAHTKDFKSLKSAEKFISKYGYKETT